MALLVILYIGYLIYVASNSMETLGIHMIFLAIGVVALETILQIMWYFGIIQFSAWSL